MKIAVAYENGQVFQHFGRTQQFKEYEVEDGKIISSKVTGTGGASHEALADVLAGRGVKVLICGGLGMGAIHALEGAGIEVISGAAGDADKAVEDYLAGKLESKGATCNHHGHHEGGQEGGCGDHSGEGCGHGDEAGGNENEHADENTTSHGRKVLFEGRNAGKKVKAHYRGTFNDGTQFDSSYDRGEPLEFICGTGMMIPGFDRAVADMEVGQIVDVHLMPEEAYGQPDPNLIFTVRIDDVPGSEVLSVGEKPYMRDQYGRPFQVVVTAKDDDTITFDANHQMAGKELNFRIELVEVGD